MKSTNMLSACALVSCGLFGVPAHAVPLTANAAFDHLYLNPFEEMLASTGVIDHGVGPEHVCDAIEYGQAMGLFQKVRRCKTKEGSVVSGDDVSPTESGYETDVESLDLQVRYTQITTEDLDGNVVHFLSAQTMPSTTVRTDVRTSRIHYRDNGDYDPYVRMENYFRFARIRMCLLEGARQDCDDADDDRVYGLLANKRLTTDSISPDDVMQGDTGRRTTHSYRMTGDGRLLVVTDANGGSNEASWLFRETPGFYSDVRDYPAGISYSMTYRTLGAANDTLAYQAVSDYLDDWTVADGAQGGRLDMTTLWTVDASAIGSRNLRMAVKVRAASAELRNVETTPALLSGSPEDAYEARSSAAFDIEPDYFRWIDISSGLSGTN